MAQPPLSQAILKLEREIGVELLARTRRSVALTEAGAIFLEEARRAIAQAEQAVAAAQRAARGQVGTVRLTYVGAASYAYLPRLLRAFRDRHLGVEVSLQERTTAAQILAIRRGEADVGLVRPPVLGADDLRTATVLSEPLVAALPHDHPLCRAEHLRMADLADESFIMFPAHEGPSFYARVVLACETAGFTMRVVQEATQMHAIVGLVANGLGVALVPASMRALGVNGVTYCELAEAPAGLTVDLALLWRRGEPSSAVTRFLETARLTAMT